MFKTYVSGEVLYASDLNSSLTTIHNNGVALVSPWTASMDAGGFNLTALDELAFNNAAAVPSAAGRWRRSGAGIEWHGEDARTNSIATGLVVTATTSGTPTTDIGTGILVRAESADETPSNIGQLSFGFSDTTAGSEDSYLDVLCRVAGAALGQIWRLAATANFRGIFTHANTADRTYTFQNSSDTIVGRATTDTLTNKTLTSPTLTAPAIGAATGASLVLTGDVSAATVSGAQVATQANQETATALDLIVTPGRQHFHPGAPKAWGLITAPTTVTVSYPAAGVSNTNPSTGVYVVTHGVTISSTNYAVLLTALDATNGARGCLTARDATTFTASFRDTTDNLANVTAFSYLVLGDL